MQDANIVCIFHSLICTDSPKGFLRLDFMRMMCIIGSRNRFPFSGEVNDMKLIYPAIFTPYFDEGGYDVTVPDLPDCIASGDTLGEAIEDAVKQASGVILSIMEKGGDVPPASEYQDVVLEDPDDFVSLIVLDMGAYSDARAVKSVRKNITIPAWLNAYGEAHNVNFSKVLQEALLSMTQKKSERRDHGRQSQT